MSTKTKTEIIDDQTSNFDKIATGLGLAAMTMATALGVVELEHARMPKSAMQLQPAYAQVAEMPHFGSGEEHIRREKDEIRHAHPSYGVTMRSHPTAGGI